MFKSKMILVVVLIVALISTLYVTATAATPIKVKVDGDYVYANANPEIQGNEVLVPAKVIFEACGATVTATSTGMKVESTGKSISIVTKSANATVNGATVKMAVAPKVVKSTTLIPLSFINSVMGTSGQYNKSLNTVVINYFTKMSGTLKIGGSTTIQPIAQSASDALMDVNSGLSITVAGGGSGAGIKGAMDGTFNIGMSSAELTASDKSTYPGIKEYQIGKDGIAVILNPSNPVKNLTKQQVIDIFTGKITNWKDVGGNNAPIFIQTREATSGTLKAFGELALEKKAVASTATPHTSNGLMLQAVGANKNAIGFLSMGYLNKTVSAVKIENISATQVNALSGKWPYVRPLIIVTNGTPSALAAKYIDYLLSSEGQSMISSEGYLPLKSVGSND